MFLKFEQKELLRTQESDFSATMRNATVRLHTKIRHPPNFMLAEMVCDAGGTDELVRYATLPMLCVPTYVSRLFHRRTHQLRK